MNMRQCCSQSVHSCTVIATQQPAVAGRQVRNFRAPAAQLTPPMGGFLLKLFYDGTMREIE